jgi:TonB-linked SusC/RagA family outer membrane protein
MDFKIEHKTKVMGMKVDEQIQYTCTVLLFLVLLVFSPEVLKAAQGQATAQVQNVTLSELKQNFYKAELEMEISVILVEATLDEALSHIAMKAGLKLTYRGDILTERSITLQQEELSVSDALESVLAGTGLDYQVSQDGYLLITKSNDDALTFEDLNFQETITGTVTDAQTGESLPGVNILVQGTSTGTTTNINGEYELTLDSLNETLIFSYIGYASLEVSIDGRTEIDIELTLAEIAGEEVVVIGYGTQEATNITGSIARANAEEITRVTTPTLASSLQGKTSGVFIKTRNAQPGENKTDINIRGFGDPLFIVDGQPVSAQIFQELDPNDIEELNVLKDAASAAVYGARAGNGVIIVRTKRGEISPIPQFSYKFDLGFQYITTIPDVLESYEWTRLRNHFDENRGFSPSYTDEQLDLYFQHRHGTAPEEYPNTNMFDMVLRDYAPQQSHNLSVRGGGETVRYFVSGSWFDQYGLMKSNDINFDRRSVRSNLDITLSERLNLGLDLSVTNRDYIGPRNQMEGQSWAEGQGIWIRAFRWRPWYSVEPLPDPSLLRGAVGGATINPANAMHIENSGYIDWDSQYMDAKATFDYELLDVLNARAIFNFTRDHYNYKHFQRAGNEYQWDHELNEPFFVRSINELTELRERKTKEYNANVQLVLEYDQMFGARHRLQGLAVYEQLEGDFKRIEAWRQNYEFDVDQLWAGPNDSKDNDSIERENSRVGFINRITYNYDQRYTLELSSRYDGSSSFPEESRWGFFPSASVGWQITNESFILNNSAFDFLSNLRLRASYGRLGYDRAGDFQYLSTYSFSQQYIYDSSTLSQGISSGVIPNPNITWEKMDIANIGLDFSLWSGLLSGSFDVFQRDRSDVLGSRLATLPNVVGAQLPEVNYQEFRNRGLEVMLNHRNMLGDISYNVGLNFSFHKETTLFTDEPHFINKEIERRNTRIGYSPGVVWMFPTDGLFRTQEEIDNWADQDGRRNATIQPGDVRFVDTNGDGRITADDMIIAGSGVTPRFTFGVNYQVGFRGFELYMLWQGAALYGYNLRSAAEFSNPFGSDSNPLRHMYEDSFVPEGDRWMPANTDARWPKVGRASGNPSYNGNSDFWWIDETYLRLRNIQLSYNLPANVSNTIGIRNARVYVSGFNLFTLSTLDFMDPEIDTNPQQGMGNYHPQTGSYNIGIEIDF